MNKLFGWAARTALLVMVAIVAGGWFDSEATQRKAFIEFLQAQIVNRPGVHVPALTPDDEKKFGPYVAHYKLMTDFVGDPVMTSTMKKMVSGLPPINSTQMVVEQRVKIRSMSQEFGDAIKTIDEKYAKAKAARAALKQPDDLKAVYDKVFEKLIGAPMREFDSATPITQALCIAIADVADYAVAHPQTVKINPANFSPTDAKTRDELMKLVAVVQARGKDHAESRSGCRW